MMKNYFSHSKPTPLGTIPEDIKVDGYAKEMTLGQYGFYVDANKIRIGDMRRIPSYRAIEATKIIKAAETLTQMKYETK